MAADITYHGVCYRREHQTNTHTYYQAPLSGVTVTLYDTDGTSVLATDTTDAAGCFDFTTVTVTSTSCYIGAVLDNYFCEFAPLYRVDFVHEDTIYGGIRLIPSPGAAGDACLLRCRVVSYTTDSTGSYNWRPSTTGSMQVQLLDAPKLIDNRQGHPQISNVTSITAVSNSDGEIDVILPVNTICLCTVAGYKYTLLVDENKDITHYLR